MFKFKKSPLFFLIVLLIGIFPTFFALTKPGYYNMHDDMQMIRQLELEKCLKDGQIPCRWTPDLGYEYGYPLFNFYPPMPYIVGQIYRTFGVSFVGTVKLTAITQIILSTFFMFLLASSVFGNVGGLIAALFYAYAPYHAVNIYVRGAMNEAWAAVFFPLIFYFSRKLILDKKISSAVGLSLSFAGLFLSHNPMVLTFTPILVVWCIFWLIIEEKNFIKKFIKEIPLFIKFIFSGIFSLALVAFFTLPLLAETKYTHIATMFTGYYTYDVHFTTLKQLFYSNFWGDGPSVWGPYDGFSYMIGYLHWIIPVLIIFTSIFLFIKRKTLDHRILVSLLVLTLGFGAALMTHNKSTFIWKLFPTLQQIQFPWRFLNHTAFLLSLSVGVLPFLLSKFLKEKLVKIAITLTLIALILINVNYFFPITSGPITDEQKFSGKAWTNQITSGIYDYLPLTASIAAKAEAKPYVDEVSPDTVQYNLSGQKKGTDWLYFNISLNKDAKVTISQLAFPNFEITDKNQKIDYQIENTYGRMVVDLKAGDHQIFVKLKNTPIRTISNYISLVAWALLAVYLTKPLWSKLIFKK